MEIIVDLFNQHSGNVDELKRMALSAYLNGADVAKIQILNSKRIWGDDSRKYLEMTYDEVKDFYDFCIRVGSNRLNKRALTTLIGSGAMDSIGDRKKLYNLLDKGNEAIDGILNLAKEGEHPRAYEVAGQLIKTVSEVSQNLLDLQDKLKKVKDIPDKGPKNVTNALFVGSTTELQKMLKKNK